MLSGWTRLRGRSFDELRVRAQQRLAVWSERAGISSQTRVPSDARFARLLVPRQDSTAPSAAALLEQFRTRTTPRFFAAFGEPEDVVATLRRRWPELEGPVVARADRICQGQFDLLGRSRVDFGTPIDWQRDPLSGARPRTTHWSRINYLDPKVAGEYKLIWELNRHQYFATLGKAYWYTGDEGYAATFVEHLMAWMEANPPKRGINWSSSLELAFRVISWIWGLYFFRTSPSLTPAAFLRTLKFLVLHGRHIETYLSTYHSPNTHLTGEALALLYLGTLFPEVCDAARWRRVGSSILVEQLDKHVRPDGSYFEQSTYYHRYTTDFYLHVSILGQLNGFPADAVMREKLQALLTPLMYLTQPDGRTPLMGDDDGGRLLALDERAPDDFRAALATGAVLFERPDYRHVAGEAAEETVWLLGCAGLRAFDGMKSVPPAQTSRAFPDSGSYVMRDGWDSQASSLVMDCGPHDVRGHAHDDALGFTLVARGTPVLVDAGTYTYTSPSEMRDHFRSSLAHNTVTVAGQPASVPGEPFSWRHVARSAVRTWMSGTRCDYFEGGHDGYARLTPPALHSRAVLFLKGDYWVIRDRVRTESDYDVAVQLHFAAGIALEIASPSRAAARWSCDSHPAMLEIGVFGHQGVLRAGEGWVSPSYGALSLAPTCVFTARARGPREVVSFFVPRSGNEEAVHIQERPATSGRAFVVVHRDVEDIVLVGGAGRAASGDLTATAEWAWVRRARHGGLPSEFVMLQGRSLSWRGRPLVEADVPVPYIAARRQGVELHVETDVAGRCDVDLLGAERMVVSGEAARTGRVVESRTAAAPLAVS
jgi:hypothetical protein